MYYDEELAYGGEPVQKYNGEIPYNFHVHEPLPQHEVNSSYHRRNIDFHGKTLTAPLLAELNKYIDRDDELKNFHKNFNIKRIFAKPGDIRFAVIGPTGAGKSTLLNITHAGGRLSTEVSLTIFLRQAITKILSSQVGREVRRKLLSSSLVLFRRTSKSPSPYSTN